MTKTPIRRKTPSPETNLPPQIPTQVKLTMPMETPQIRRKMESKLRIHEELLKIKRIFEIVSNLPTAS